MIISLAYDELFRHIYLIFLRLITIDSGLFGLCFNYFVILFDFIANSFLNVVIFRLICWLILNHSVIFILIYFHKD